MVACGDDLDVVSACEAQMLSGVCHITHFPDAPVCELEYPEEAGAGGTGGMTAAGTGAAGTAAAGAGAAGASGSAGTDAGTAGSGGEGGSSDAGTPDAGMPLAGDGGEGGEPSEDGCSCSTQGADFSPSTGLIAAGLIWAGLRRRRRR